MRKAAFLEVWFSEISLACKSSILAPNLLVRRSEDTGRRYDRDVSRRPGGFMVEETVIGLGPVIR